MTNANVINQSEMDQNSIVLSQKKELKPNRDYFLPGGQIIRKLSKTDIPALNDAITDDDSLYTRNYQNRSTEKSITPEKWSFVEVGSERQIVSCREESGKTCFYDYQMVNISSTVTV